jgi:exopolysaccharide production protein ExoQ
MWLAAFGIGPAVTWSATTELEGTPLDRNLYTALLALGIIVLIGRAAHISRLLRANVPLILFFLYCAVSVLWSDYPLVSAKRWIKSLADITLVLIVLTDSDPLEAIKRLLKRAGFIIVPLSILVIKYYPEIGVKYGHSEGKRVVIGLAWDKNTLGAITLLFGLGFLWRFLNAYRDRRGVCRTRQLLVHGALLAMVMWLFAHANSMTSFLCFILVSGVIVAMSISSLARRPPIATTLTVLVLLIVAVPLVFSVGTDLFHVVGRDGTLTGRTGIWDEALSMVTNPVLGSGFESFWLKVTLDEGRSFHLNEAHNGYLEVYLNLGIVGICLLAVVVLSGYRNVMRVLRQDPEPGILFLGFWVVCLTYSMTEAGFRMMNLVWICFLMASTVAPEAFGRLVKASPVTPTPGSPVLLTVRDSAWYSRPPVGPGSPDTASSFRYKSPVPAKGSKRS